MSGRHPLGLPRKTICSVDFIQGASKVMDKIQRLRDKIRRLRLIMVNISSILTVMLLYIEQTQITLTSLKPHVFILALKLDDS